MKEPDLTPLMIDDSKVAAGFIKSKKNDTKDQEDEEEKMEEEEDTDIKGVDDEGEKDPVKSIKAFKKLVVRTLEENQMQEKRACKMEIIDFLNLLKIFNEKGIHFK